MNNSVTHYSATIHYEMVTGLPSAPLLQSLLDLHLTVFPNQLREEVLAEMRYYQNRRLTVWLARCHDRVIGYKMGYERKEGHFYSWLGCVEPDYRGHGVATRLMTEQHEWCRHNGYRAVRTQTYNQWRSMLLLNIRQGFDIIGTQQGTYGLVIVLEKKL
ncbi:GNAT family N-acetyltransferase [Arsenicibacter rosenii]|nr:GNAT family N-acetyltransferase [Arsenicibacter rosenii]